MSAPTVVQLADMRAQVNLLLPETAVINTLGTAGWTSDGAGGGTVVWSPVTGGTVAARLDPLQISRADMTELQQATGREIMMSLYQLTLPYNAPIEENAQVVIGARTYEVRKLDDVHSWNVSRRAIVMELR